MDLKMALGFKRVLAFTALLFVVGLGTAPALAQSDDTGTNPINFTWDWRSYVEMQTIPGGDNSRTVMTIEQRLPLGPTSSLRYRVRHVSVSIDPEQDGSATEVSGIGDFDARLVYVPYSQEKGAIALGLEGTFDTASNMFLGAGKTTLGPQIFGVLFQPPGGGVLLAPAYQYVFDIAGDEDRATINRSQFDVFYLWLAENKKWWVLADPQAVIDHENEMEFGLFEAEYGRMIMGGISSYVRPSVGIGEDRPYDWSAEFGFKAIYR